MGPHNTDRRPVSEGTFGPLAGLAARPPALPVRHWGNWFLILALCFVVALARTGGHSTSVESAIDGPALRAGELDQRIDPNTAPWWELAQLPGIGEKTAKAIVEARGAGPAPRFRSIEDLDDVPRIGPKTLQKIAPYLRFGDG